ncbi:MAG: glutamate 5-kinase, partial [Actinomycetota bacterium]|nr:glutamate 5-kinase [Actinomycetota bacterium]
RSLLPAGVRGVEGRFEPEDPVEVIGPDGRPFAKGLVRYGSAALAAVAGSRTQALPEGAPHEVIHRDDLVVLP